METALTERWRHQLQLFARQQPRIAMKLSTLSPSKVQANPKTAKSEAWFKQLSLQDVQVLYLFGVGQNDTYPMLSPWLHGKRNRALVFLEDDLQTLCNFIASEEAAAILSDPQVRVYALHTPAENDRLFNQLAWDHACKPMEVIASRDYALRRAKKFAELRDRLVYEQHCKNEIAQEYLDQGIVFYQNFYANILQLHTCYLGDALFEQFKGTPAIICGAGPSLHKQIPLLRTLKDNALIFAGGSALNALSHAGIQPHFGCGIDPNAPQLHRLRAQPGYEIPFFFRLRMHQGAFKKIRGPRLYITGTGGYNTARYFEEKLGIHSSELDEGHNVVNFSLSIAHALGCHPIIFVGLDLAYTDMKAYAQGVVADPKVSVEAITQKGIDHAAILRQDIYGRPIYTLWKWISESQWISAFAASHPTLELINATEGGIGVDKVPNLPFADVVNSKLKQSWDLDGHVWGSIQNAFMPRGTKKKVADALQALHASLTRCQAIIEDFLQHIRAGQWSRGLQTLTEVELEHEIAFPAVLRIFSLFSERMQAYSQQCLAWDTANEKSRSKRFIALQRQHYTFLKKVVRSHIALIDYTQQRCAVKHESQPKHVTATPLKIRSPRKLGLLQGRSCVWNATGTLLSESRFNKGQREGTCRRYYANGQLYMEATYSKGVLLGAQRYFYPNGQLKTKARRA